MFGIEQIKDFRVFRDHLYTIWKYNYKVENSLKIVERISMDRAFTISPQEVVGMLRRQTGPEEEEEYFDSYEDIEVHRLMLEDLPRMTAYKNAILQNKEYFKDKVVMDVGCGTGVLSIFCAQAGAKKVYAVEASNIATMTQKIVKNNNMEKVIEVIHSRVEDVVLPDNIKVDAIVSEWMGFYLLHEGMLDSVIAARDKFLKPDGKMFPESAVIYVAPCRLPKLNGFWKNVHGVNMTSFAKYLKQDKMNKPEIMTITKADLLGPQEALCWVNLIEDKVTDFDEYSLQHVIGANKRSQFEGICIWFECNFPISGEVLDTSPKSEPTHWKQTVIVLPESTPVDKDEPIAFQLEMKRAPDNPRRYNLSLEILDYTTIDHPIPCTCYMTKCILIRRLMISHKQHAKESDKEVEQEKRMNIAEDDLNETIEENQSSGEELQMNE